MTDHYISVFLSKYIKQKYNKEMLNTHIFLHLELVFSFFCLFPLPTPLFEELRYSLGVLDAQYVCLKRLG